MNKWQRVTSMTMSAAMLMICLANTHIIAQAEEQEEPTTPIIFISGTEMIEETPQAELLENPQLTSEIVFGVNTENIEKTTPGVIIETPFEVYEEEEVVLITNKWHEIDKALYIGDEMFDIIINYLQKEEVIAWMPLPEPYKAERKDEE